MEFSYRVSSQTADIFKIKLENFILLLKNQDISESFKEKKQSLNLFSFLFKLNLSANKKLLTQNNFISNNLPQHSHNTPSIYTELKNTSFLGYCSCEKCSMGKVRKMDSMRNINEKMQKSTSYIYDSQYCSKMANKRNPYLKSINLDNKELFDDRFKKNKLCYTQERTNKSLYIQNSYKENKTLQENQNKNNIKRKSFFLQRKKNQTCAYDKLKEQIYSSIKKKSRGFSSINYSVMANVKPRKNGYFHSFRLKSRTIIV